MNRRITVTAALALGVLGLAALALSGGRSEARPPAGERTSLVRQLDAADALTRAPATPLSPASPTRRTEADLRRAGARLEAGVPLPPGGTFDRIDWVAAAAQGGDSEAGMRFTIEYQAACQWYAYALADGASADALKVIGTIPDWPTFRADPPTAAATSARQMLRALRTGDGDAVRSFLAVNCATATGAG